MGITGSIPLLLFGFYNTIISIRNKFFSIKIIGYFREGTLPRRSIELKVIDNTTEKVLNTISQADSNGGFDITLVRLKKEPIAIKLIGTVNSIVQESEVFNVERKGRIEHSFIYPERDDQ